MTATNAAVELAIAKRAAAERAAALIEDGMVVGLGSGTTAALFIEALGVRVAGGLRIKGAVTSNESGRLASRAGIALVDIALSPVIDVDVDGADEIDPQLNLLKGGGGALLHEKLIALSSRRVVVIADETKLVQRLGHRPIPVEVVAFYARATEKRIRDLSAEPELRMEGASPFVTDSGNNILDVPVPPGFEALAFAQALKLVPGVVEHGIFPAMTDLALVGSPDGSVRELRSGLQG